MTDAQVDFVLLVQRQYDAADLSPDLISKVFRAAARNEDAEIARLAGHMILELHSLQRRPIGELATKWFELFGAMFLESL